MSTAIEKANGHPVASAEPRYDPKAMAEADAIRARTEAEIEARRIAAEAEAEAVRIKATEEAERQRLANERARMRLEKEQAENAAKVAEANRKREQAEREAAEARAKTEAEQRATEIAAAETKATSDRWRQYALGFYIVCAIVALPVQIAAFWSPRAPWLIVAPLMLEGGAWVVLKGAAAAVADRRPHWHYRAIAWCLAFIAAGINLWHGMHAFDPATAIGTAFASVAGPGVWDLHEHGRIRVRDGKLSWAQRRAQRKAERKTAAEKAAAAKRAATEKKAAEEAAAEAAQELAAVRAEAYPEVWDHAVRLAAALGETTVTEAVWKRAHRDVEGADPGESVDIIRARNMAERRVAAARSEAPGSTPVKVNSSQVDQQVLTGNRRGHKNGPPRRGTRTKGDTAKFAKGARNQASIAAKKATATTTD